MRSIRITGKGQIKVRPDTVRITLKLEGLDPEYDRALWHSSQDTEEMKDLLCAFGFDPFDLKTLQFNIETEYESYTENDSYRQRFRGYRYQHLMKLEFPSDRERLGKVLHALTRSPLEPEFMLSYTVSDPGRVKNELLARAVSDAREKALLISQAAGVLLKDIQSIDYSWGEINLECKPCGSLMAQDCLTESAGNRDSFDLNIEPDDMEVTDTVTVLWEIG